jgi:hypothetical protein
MSLDDDALRHFLPRLMELMLPSVQSALNAMIFDWLKKPVVGEALQTAFFAAGSEDAAQQLSSAHDLWIVCARLRPGIRR